MTSTEFINNIISSRGKHNFSEGEYWEGHHIIPRCMGGEGDYRSDAENLIWLTLQEHYEVHKLLAQENPNNTSLQRAWFMMSHKDGVFITAEEYAEAKRAFIKAISGDNSPMKKDIVRQHLREGAAKRDKSTYKGVSRLGKLNPNYGNHRIAGENHFYYGKHRDKATCDKVSRTRIERGVAKGANNPRARAVICSREGTEDKIYATGAEAAAAVKGAKSGICRACKTGVIYKGYYWRYK